MNTPQFITNQQGYTLAEAIVAIGILASALLGTLLLAVQAINVTDIAQTKTQAEFLAEEGIELTRAFREDSAGNFKLFDTSSPCPAGGCPATTYAELLQKIPNEGNFIEINIDAKQRVCEGILNTALTTSCIQLYINHDPSKDNRYVLRDDGNTATRFRRTIRLTRKKDNSNPQNLFVEVSSKVDFEIRGVSGPVTYSLTTDLYDWM